MRTGELFAIDLAAEVATLCEAQLQGPWQVPAELVRLASARGAAAVSVDRRGFGIELQSDGLLASPDELVDLAGVFDPGLPPARRQDAIGRIEAAGMSALLWAAGLPGARLELESRTSAVGLRLRARRGRVETDTFEAAPGAPSTVLVWRCRRLAVRRALAWLRTALRFVPMPVMVCGRPVARGFPGGLYRMRLVDPLPAELAVTADGDSPQLWLLEHGVLSARAVVPGYPAFSAAIEMTGVTGDRSSADDLRTAVNPHLESLIDETVRMLLLLADRIPTMDETVRRRHATLLLRAGVLELRRERVLETPIVRCAEGDAWSMTTPAEVARRAAEHGGLVTAVEPARRMVANHHRGWRIEASAEERSLLSELLGVRIERAGDGRRGRDGVARLGGLIRRGWRAARGLAPPRPLEPERLTAGERRLVEAAASAGVELGLCRGTGHLRTRGSRILVGRERSEVVAAVGALTGGDEWLYPALLATVGSVRELPEPLRRRWLEETAARMPPTDRPEL